MRILFRGTFIFLFLSNAIHAQIGGRAFMFRPTGDFGFWMKPAYSLELMYIKPFEEEKWYRYNVSLTAMDMKPRLEPFPVYSTSGKQIKPGEFTFQRYLLVEAMPGIDVAVFKKEKWSAFIGSDVTIGLSDIEYTNIIKTVTDEGSVDMGVLIGLRYRIGAEYKLNDNLYLFTTVNRGFIYAGTPKGFLWGNDYGIGIHYQFDFE